MGSRTGSSVDRDNLQKVLKFVGFKDIRVKNNLKQKDMIRLMEDGMCIILIAELLLTYKVCSTGLCMGKNEQANMTETL